jgi:uncharacterized protein (DUF2062 family)
MRHFIAHHGKRLLLHERSPKKLALAVSVALYVAISPFLGLHTIMLVVAGWAFGLNIPVLIIVSYTLNNPWTMVPLMLGGYWVGYKILHTWLELSVEAINPPLMHLINDYLYQYLGLQDVSFWAWMLGGNIVGVAVALGAYPFLYALFKKISADAEGI